MLHRMIVPLPFLHSLGENELDDSEKKMFREAAWPGLELVL